MSEDYYYDPPPGPPLNPNDYRSIGPNGQHYGQLEGFDYNETTDTYIKKPKEQKKPGVGQYLAPIAGAAVAYGGGQYIGNHGFGGLFGLGGSTKPTPSTAPTPTPIASGGANPAPYSGGSPATANIGGAAPFSGGSGAPATPQLVTQSGELSGSASPAPSVVNGSPVSSASGASGIFGPSTGTVGLNSLQTLGPAAAVAAYYGPSAYEHGKPILQGKGSDDDRLKAGLLSNPVTAWAVPIADKLGIGIGHGKNYYNAQDRDSVLTELSHGSGVLQFDKPDGSKFTLRAKDYRNIPSTYNYDQSSPTMATDIGAAHALAYLQTGDVDSTRYHQLTGALANAHQQGVTTDELFKKFGLDYNTAYQQIANSDLKKDDKDVLLNGLDQSFGQNAYRNGGGAIQQGVANSLIKSAGGTPPPRPVMTGVRRVSPGVYEDSKGTFNSKTGVRGK